MILRRCLAALGCGILLPTALARGSDSRDPIDVQVFSVLEAFEAGNRTQAYKAARSLNERFPGDWRTWYARLLAIEEHPLEPHESAALEQIPDADQREGIRGLWAYLAAPDETRLMLALDLERREPKSALIQSLVASSLLSAGDGAAASDAAQRALQLDPDQFLAARVLVTTLSTSGPGGADSSGCELLAAFPRDPYIVNRGLETCWREPDPNLRREYFVPLLETMRGRAESAVALDRIVAPPAASVNSTLLQAALSKLDPADAIWFPQARALLELIMADRRDLKTAGDQLFLAKLFESLRAGHSPENDVALEAAGIAYSRYLRLTGAVDAAKGIVEETMRSISPLRRARCFEALASIARRQRSPEEARHYKYGLRLLTGRAVSEVGPRPNIFPRFNSMTLSDRLGTTQTLVADGSTPLVLIFWKAGCQWASKEAARLHERDRSGDFSGMRIAWINFDAASRQVSAATQSAAMMLPDGMSFFGGASDPLVRTLEIDGSPSIYVVAPDGFIIREIRGYSHETWDHEIPATLQAYERYAKLRPATKEVHESL